MILAHASIVGTVPGWLTAILVAVFAAFVYHRGGANEALDVLQKSNHVLVRERNRLELDNAKQQNRIEILESQRDFTKALAPIVALLEQQHHQNVDTFDKHMALLSIIADRLGAE